ncbi:beta-1,6-N-acetylglucosaminyltransferase [Lacticaseibacillus paracasei]|uniref:beta-1,6-N-acetylglucosaminyltransferase n=1 Tax=Lacticaseibacillus paracasei TaxID=1597 RepID=UPI000FF56CA2|nr:beta-1,6-N-acetylglucosaminyltransferase [Lacticaseibacillus paracasei]RND58139.1 Core-2/I-Branching enzyme [Lacticaseibacillus paracasei]
MKIAYIVLCHKNPLTVSTIIRHLLTDESSVVILHVDASVDEQPYRTKISDQKNLHFVSDRVDVHWGGFSAIIATIKAMQVGQNLDCDRFYVLQGVDAPIQSLNEIENFFEQHSKTEFIRAYNVTTSRRKSTYMKAYGLHINDVAHLNCVTRFASKALNLLNKSGVKYRPGTIWNDQHTKKMEIFWGWAHVALTRKCVDYIVKFYHENPKFNKKFSFVFPADETYFQTIIYNSSLLFNTFDRGPVSEATHGTVQSMLNLTYFEYPDQVRVYSNPAEVAPFVKHKYLFLRKVDNTYLLRSEWEE